MKGEYSRFSGQFKLESKVILYYYIILLLVSNSVLPSKPSVGVLKHIF